MSKVFKPVPSYWEEPLAKWQVWLQAKGYRQQTVYLRLNHMRTVSRGLGAPPKEITFDDLIAYFGSRAWAPSTRKSYRASAVAFFGYLWRDDPQMDPAKGLPTVSVPGKVARPTPVDVIEDGLHASGEREHLMIRLMAEASLRIGEVVLVRLDDLIPDLLGHSLVVHGKGGKERVVQLTDDLARELIAYGRKVGSGWVFPGDKEGHLSANWAGKLVTRSLSGWNAHTLRHRFGTAAYEGTRDIQAVAKAMGHASTVTTQVYVRPSVTAELSVALAASLRTPIATQDSIRLASGSRAVLTPGLLRISSDAGREIEIPLDSSDVRNLAELFTKHANRR